MIYYESLTEDYDDATGHLILEGELITPYERITEFSTLPNKVFRIVDVSDDDIIVGQGGTLYRR